ncbi:hypothetical protein QJS66_18945 [Kocuria rhizophila]|nr:hypothetical protein QJS66_18945 [Kocuria rhizophila]
MAAIFRVSRNSMREALRRSWRRRASSSSSEGPHRAILPILVPGGPTTSAGPALQLHMRHLQRPCGTSSKPGCCWGPAALHASEQRWIPRDDCRGSWRSAGEPGAQATTDLYVSPTSPW